MKIALILNKLMMKLIIKLFAILMLLSGISLIFAPEIIIGWIENNIGSTTMYLSAIVVRLIIGLLFIITGKESKYPSVIKFFGYLFVIAALIFIFIGQETFQDFIASLIPDVIPFAPVSGLLSIVFGGFLIYAFSNKKELK